MTHNSRKAWKTIRKLSNDPTTSNPPCLVSANQVPKSYRAIALLCHTYKLYERMILNRIAPTIERHLNKEHAGFRRGKSCTIQLLNLTQHIEDGSQESIITGTAFVDPSAAYDTVNHRLLIQKLFNITQDSTLCRVFRTWCQTEDSMWS